MTREDFEEENKLLRELLLQSNRDRDELMTENKALLKYKELYWHHRAKMDEGE